jgi:hypothetical protein
VISIVVSTAVDRLLRVAEGGSLLCMFALIALIAFRPEKFFSGIMNATTDAAAALLVVPRQFLFSNALYIGCVVVPFHGIHSPCSR